MSRAPGDPYGPRRESERNPRARGTNPRARGTNPRRSGTNPSAGTSSDRARVERLRRRALARWRVSTGEPWCPTCDDTRWSSTPAGFVACPDHREMTANDADSILRGTYTIT